MKKHGLLSGFLVVCVLGFAILPRSAAAQSGTANEWTWMGGSSTPNQLGVPGYLGVPTSSNIPSSRDGAASWTDANGNLWLFSGEGYTYSDSGAGGTFLGEPNDLWEFNPSTNEWAWMGGDRGVVAGANPGVYGALGVPSSQNIPGSRIDASTWSAAGKLWLFGGFGVDSAGNLGDLNDLWEFNPSTMQWAWMGGSSTLPGNDGYLPGVYGTLGTPAAGNIPGSRLNASTWSDSSGNLWLFGGEGFAANSNYGGPLGDLWEFNPSTSEWAWMGGSVPTNCFGGDKCGQSGVYGTLKTPGTGNVPGSRYGASTWIDRSGNLWLFGGAGNDANGSSGYLNDLWEFDPVANEWAWMGGSSTIPGPDEVQPGIYGTLGSPAAGNIPGGRQSPVSWTDINGNLWLFGGYSYNVYGDADELNDLWEFYPSTNEWAWMGGSSTMSCTAIACSEPGLYGTLGTPAAGNLPIGRQSAVSWTDNGGTLWLFGGEGFGSPSVGGLRLTGVVVYLNDLWLYQLSTASKVPQDSFSVGVSPGAIAVVAGQSGTTGVTVTPLPRFTSTISFSCSSGLPAGATCSFSPATVTLQGTAAASTTLTVATSATTGALRRNGGTLPLEAALAVVFCCIGWKRRWHVRMLAMAAVSVVGLGLINGCGGGSASTGSPPPTHQPLTAIITVTATSGAATGNLTNSTTISLTLN